MTVHRIAGHKLLNFAPDIDPGTVEQARQTAAMPFVHPHVALMPDAHRGKGSAVGTVIPTEGAVIPAAVGVDIGCGMIAARTRYTAAEIGRSSAPTSRTLAVLRKSIESAIPLSPGNYNKSLHEIEVERLNCHHNYTRQEHHGGRDVWLTRKGAVDAHAGVRAVIPGSMGTRSYIVRGNGNPAGLCSAPHGAGRRFSRTEAPADDLAARMKGIEYRHGGQWVDEIPDAYTDIDVVMEDAKDLVEIDHELRQLLNVKGT